MRKMFIICILLGLSWLVMSGCRPRTEQAVILARVNNAALTLPDLEANIPLGFQDMFTKEQKTEYINRWIEDELLHQEARQAQLHLDEDIASAVRQLTREFLIQKLLERRLARDITVPEEDIKTYYQLNRKDFILEQPTIRARQILVKNSKTAWEVKSKLRQGEDFGLLAKQYSIDPSVDLEGDMGYFTKWDIDPQLSRRCFTMKKNAFSNPIKTQSGYHIIKVLDKRRKGDPKPLPMVRESIINILSKQKKKENLENLIRQLREKYTITIDLSPLDKNTTPAPAADGPARPDAAAPADLKTTPTTDAQDKY